MSSGSNESGGLPKPRSMTSGGMGVWMTGCGFIDASMIKLWKEF